MLAVYAATLAPSITFWDAAEFAAAARGLGIPHPPGTPLWVLLGRLFSFALPPEHAALGTNMLSALCTAGAGAIAALLVARWTSSGAMGLAAALSAGSMATVWLNATETEVYAAALLLAMAALLAADRAASRGEGRAVALVAYLVALAPALHLISLLAAPAAILHAGSGERRRDVRDVGLTLGAVFLLAVAVGRGSIALAVLATAALALLALRRAGRSADDLSAPRTAVPVAAALAAAVALSATAVLLVRAAHDPALNQGDPSTLARLADVVARRQYDVAPLFPRQAPLWLQTANLLQYADWQVGFGLAPRVELSPWRTLAALLWLVLAALGSLAHRRLHPRSWRTVALLGLCGSIGAMLYLNLKAGPSIGWGFLPDDAPHEARERDYFFLFGFWVWGLWAGIGAVGLAARVRLPGAAGLAIAALPIALNWPATDRRREPEASIARTFAEALLRSVPPRGVLFVAADNDTYPLWYLQQVEGVRPDVVVVAVPLLPADWYRAELRRRHRLVPDSLVGEWPGTGRLLEGIASTARSLGRPIAASTTVTPPDRARLAERWRLAGFVFVADASASPDAAGKDVTPRRPAPSVDSSAAVEALVWRDRRLPAAAPRPFPDPVARQMRRTLECPRWALDAGRDEGAARSLDSICNFR